MDTGLTSQEPETAGGDLDFVACPWQGRLALASRPQNRGRDGRETRGPEAHVTIESGFSAVLLRCLELRGDFLCVDGQQVAERVAGVLCVLLHGVGEQGIG